MRSRKSSSVSIFVGALLIVVAVVGLVSEGNPEAFQRKYHYDLALDHFLWFCRQVWLPAGIIGVPVFLVSLILSLVRERRDKTP